MPNGQFWRSDKLLFFYSKIVSFLSRTSWNIICRLILPLKKKKENFAFFDKNHGLTPLQNCQFWPCKNLLFLYSKIVSFLSRSSWNIFLGSFSPQKEKETFWIFLLKSWVNPLWKNAIFGLLRSCNFFTLQ